jgi:hypothetical protein
MERGDAFGITRAFIYSDRSLATPASVAPFAMVDAESTPSWARQPVGHPENVVSVSSRWIGGSSRARCPHHGSDSRNQHAPVDFLIALDSFRTAVTVWINGFLQNWNCSLVSPRTPRVQIEWLCFAKVRTEPAVRRESSRMIGVRQL